MRTNKLKRDGKAHNLSRRTSTSRMALKAMGKGRMWRKENVSEATNVEPTTQRTSNTGTEVKRELP